jgi:uncharacterized protein YjbJ (UPF0337 family)
MWGRKEVRRPLQRPVSFLLQVRLQHGNRIDCSCGVVPARWRGLGILSLARVARTGDERALAVVRFSLFKFSGEIKGNMHAAKGTVKEKAAQVTNNPNLTADAQNEKLAGIVKKKVGQIEKVLEK